MASPQVVTKVRPPRPAAVEQIRILTWFQFHLTVITLIVMTIVGAILSGQGDWAYLVYREEARLGTNTVLMVMAVLTGIAVLLVLTAYALRRGWVVALPLVILAEVAVVAGVYLAMWAAILSSTVLGALTVLFVVAFGLLSVGLLGLGGWIVSRLFRGEVWRFLLR